MTRAKVFIPWIGGKSRLADQILPEFPAHTCYVEVFAGAAALFFRKEESKVEVINDLNGELVNLYRIVQHHLEEFVKQFKWILVSRDHWQIMIRSAPETLTDVQRAARFYYLQRAGFGGNVTGQAFGIRASHPPSLNLLRIEEDLSAAHLRLARTTIERLDWADCVRRYDRAHTLFYLDPPYWGTAGYGAPFKFEEYAKMADAMRALKGKAIVSVNDIPEMRTAFAGFRMKSLSVRTSVSRAKGLAPRRELLISSF